MMMFACVSSYLTLVALAIRWLVWVAQLRPSGPPTSLLYRCAGDARERPRCATATTIAAPPADAAGMPGRWLAGVPDLPAYYATLRVSRNAPGVIYWATMWRRDDLDEDMMVGLFETQAEAEAYAARRNRQEVKP